MGFVNRDLVFGSKCRDCFTESLGVMSEVDDRSAFAPKQVGSRTFDAVACRLSTS